MNLQELIRQRDEIENQLRQIRKEAKKGAIVEIRRIIKDYGLTKSDLDKVKELK